MAHSGIDHADRGLVTVFGGSGFIGTYLVQKLARAGYRVRVAVRRPDLAGHVRPLGAVGQVQPIQANLRYPDSVRRAVEGADIVVNLTGVLAEAGKQKFRAVHTMGAKTVAEAAAQAGVSTLVHMSALGADKEAASAYARSKALGEEEVMKAFPKAVIVRPSIVFGPDDGFFNLFGTMARLSPVLPLIGGDTKFQPVYVGDVAEALFRAATGQVKTGQTYELGGPETETMKQLLQRLLKVIGRKRILLPIPFGLASLMGSVLGLLPWKILTRDQVTQLQSDNVVSSQAVRQKRDIDAFGIEPAAMDAILPTYLWRFRKHGQFETKKTGSPATLDQQG